MAILLLHWPQQASRLVEVAVIRPAVEWLKTLLTAICSAAPIQGAVSTGAVPGHPDEERSVIAKISGPPVLRISKHRVDIFLNLFKVKL